MNPILATLDKKVELNERWTTDFLALWGVHHQTEAEETIYNQIYQVPPGSTLEVDNIDTDLLKEYYINLRKKYSKSSPLIGSFINSKINYNEQRDRM